MSILSKFKSDKLKASWRFRTKSSSVIIWKLLISPDGILAGEERDTDAKTASLFALDVPTGKMLWRDVTIDEAWWFNSERATADTIFIQKFRKPDMPEPKGIVALNIHTGVLRWEQPDVSMLFEFEGRIYSQREAIGRKEFFAIDSMSGEILEAYGSEKENILALQSMVTDTDRHSVYSMAITPDDGIFSAIADALKGVLEISELRGTIDFAEFGKYIVFSYHERIQNNPQAMLGNLLRNHLKVLDTEDGAIVFSDQPNAETPYPVPENFFIHRGVLIYVKEKREVIGVPLV
ncbi:MAG: DUF4905 domain-containing protein [Bacteroidota bacterium]|nr:DUF4905 domain-containing protein [Bacteroidota bacterium]MDP4235734.1 DUF4905 domain-containing protein [Bacteroidota bacterium]